MVRRAAVLSARMKEPLHQPLPASGRGDGRSFSLSPERRGGRVEGFLVALLLGWLAVALPASAAEVVAPAGAYEQAARNLETLIRRELDDKGLPALSIALVDDQRIVWAQGFGLGDAARKTPATAETVYRVGSVSKLFTDLAVMQLVERGELDLDAPVTRYLPDFKPTNRFGMPITLRHLMTHRSG